MGYQGTKTWGTELSYFIECRRGKRKSAYRAQIIVKQDGQILHRESRTFPVYKEAVSWGTRRDKELRKAKVDTEVFEELTVPPPPVLALSLGEIVKRYRLEYGDTYARTVGMDLRQLERTDLAKLPINKITSGDIVAHVKQRVDGIPSGSGWKVAPVTPATAGNDLTRLQTVLDAAWASFNLDVTAVRTELEKARIEARKRRLVGKAKERTRVATEVELGRLCGFFNQSARSTIPMSDVIWFAVHSCRRQEEITQLRWQDNDAEKLTGIVPRLKDPGGGRINVPFRYTREAWEIVERQPRFEGETRIFPYNHRSISAAFTRACKVLGIEDLRFHDLRHTAVTRLFQAGYQVHEVPAFSLHRSWATLKRYTNIRPEQVELR